MKFMLMMHTPAGTGDYQIYDWSPEDFKAHIASDNPMVALNHAIAAAMVQGPAAGLSLMKALDDDVRVRGPYRLDAVRAHLYEMSGDPTRAMAHYRAVAERTTSIPEQNYLKTKAARLAASQSR